MINFSLDCYDDFDTYVELPDYPDGVDDRDYVVTGCDDEYDLVY